MIKDLKVEIIKHKITIVLLVVFLFIGVIIGAFSVRLKNNISSIFEPKAEHLNGYEGALTNPLLDCENYANTGIVKLNPLKKEIEAIRKEAINEDKVSEMSIYYRNLRNGTWVGINLEAKFAPASLLKVPVMIAYLKKAETDPSVLQKRIAITDDSEMFEMTQEIKPTVYARPGETYTVDELINLMIANSDNIAKYGLTQELEESSLDEVFIDLGLMLPEFSPEDDFMTVNEYVTFFRVLYNATYLNRAMSEKALEYLVKSEFDNGIRLGVPSDIVIANKFGERSFEDDQTGKLVYQLHDCGIVYYSENPYIVCIMTRGDSYDSMSEVIGDISKQIFKYTAQSLSSEQ